MVVPSFPFLRLPSKARRSVLQNMDNFEKLNFSILSERSKHLVKSLNLQLTVFNVRIGTVVQIEVMMLSTAIQRFQLSFHYKRKLSSNSVDLLLSLDGDMPGATYATFNNETHSWEKQGYRFREWINHLQSIFNISEIDLISFDQKIDLFDVNSIRKSLKGLRVKNLIMNIEGLQVYYKMIMDVLNPIKTIFLCTNPYQGPNSLHKVLIENVCCLRLVATFQLTLNDLLICNASYLTINPAMYLTGREINRFVKHWINGSNQKMKYLCMEFQIEMENSFDKDIILNGIQYQVVPDEQERRFWKPSDHAHEFEMATIKGGFDFQRNDNTQATILLGTDDNNAPYFKMFVWSLMN